MLQMLKETGCEYDLFVKEITFLVRDIMGEGHTVTIYKVLKNNSLELDSLVILEEGKKISPNFYLLPYYEEYLMGTDMNDLAERICERYVNNTSPMILEDFNYEFGQMKECIIYRLVNYERNRKILESTPHIKYLDLAITFHCLVQDSKEEIGTIRITNDHLKFWNTNLEEIKKLAVKNTQKRFPAMIRRMEEVILSMLTNEDGDNSLKGQMMNDLFPDLSTMNLNMYILSNTHGINGATCLLYDNILKKISQELQANLYILPSSIHEVIIIPCYDEMLSKETLSKMVCEVNCTQVAKEEVLSDKVYIYSRQKNAIM